MMTMLKYKIAFPLILFIFYSFLINGQIQVSKEPNHKKVFENKYIRLLDVWINPGDTSLFHVHSTPSLFLMLSNTSAGSQILGQEWIKSRNEIGKSWYRSFMNDTLIHRVANFDTVLFHVIDIELLAPYLPNIPIQSMPFTTLFDCEKAIAYKLTQPVLDKTLISNRRPMIAILVEGREVIYCDVLKKEQRKIMTGKYLYIKPNSSFYFIANENETINMMLFEIK